MYQLMKPLLGVVFFCLNIGVANAWMLDKQELLQEASIYSYCEINSYNEESYNKCLQEKS